MVQIKNLTFMFYLNGNNELEPETWQSFLNLANEKYDDDITVVAQVARQQQFLTEQMRADYQYPQHIEHWSGVKRYKIEHNAYQLIYDPGRVNMADPHTLKDFIIWAQTEYPADHYVLILGGHIYQFVGISPDFTGEAPYLLGFPELSAAIQAACEETLASIDLLVMDTCYANTFETLCEFGKYTPPAVQYILTYIGKGPLKGLPLPLLVKKIEEAVNSANASMIIAMRRFIHSLAETAFSLPMIGIKINGEILASCIHEFDTVARLFFANKSQFSDCSPFDLLAANDTMPWYEHVFRLHILASQLIVAITPEPFYQLDRLPIHVLYKKIPNDERRELYSRLFFCSNNLWPNILCDTEQDHTILYQAPDMKPLPITKNILQSFIKNMNSHASLEKQIQIKEGIEKLYHWDLDKENSSDADGIL